MRLRISYLEGPNEGFKKIENVSLCRREDTVISSEYINTPHSLFLMYILKLCKSPCTWWENDTA